MSLPNGWLLCFLKWTKDSRKRSEIIRTSKHAIKKTYQNPSTVWCSQSRNDVKEEKAVQRVAMFAGLQFEGRELSSMSNLSLKGRHAGPHDLVDEKKIRGDDRTRIEKLHFDSIIV